MPDTLKDTVKDTVASGIRDTEWCSDVLPRVSRTFALSIEALPLSLREAVRVAYLLCRIVDTVEDQANLESRCRNELFDVFDSLIGDDAVDATQFDQRARAVDLNADGANGELCQSSSVVFRRFRALSDAQREAVRPHIAEMSVGMREFAARADAVGRLRLRDVEDLERYCYFVAGTVGKLLTALFELTVPDLTPEATLKVRERAVSFGLGLQMVNIVKDVASDHERGDCFLPESLAAAHGVALDAILEPTNREAGLAVVREVCRIARDHLGRAREYTLRWPAVSGQSVRMFCAVPLAFAFATLHEVEHGDATLVVGREPKITRTAVAQIFGEATEAIADNGSLEQLLDRCSRGEYG